MQVDQDPPVAQVANIAGLNEEENASEEKASLSVKCECEYNQYAFNEQQDTHVLVTINGQDNTPEKKERQPLDVVIVLDVSGSMSGMKLKKCIETCKFIANELGEKDRLSLVTYDTHVKTRFPLTKMDENGRTQANKDFVKVRAGSATNLSGGLVQGIEEVKRGQSCKERTSQISAILLLTDGYANHGITDITGLQKLTQTSLEQFPKDRKPKLYTFGYGSNHSENLLEALADAGDGAYFSVANVDDVAGSFADVLGGLLSIVAQSITLEVTPAGGSVLPGPPKCKYQSSSNGKGGYTIEFPDLYDGESRNILVPVHLPKLQSPVPGNDAPLLTVKVKYTDCVLKTIQTLSVQASTSRPTKIDDNLLVKSTAIQEQLTRFTMMEEMEKAEILADQGNIVQARDHLASARVKLDKELGLQKSSVMNALLNEMEDSETYMTSLHSWNGGGRKWYKVKQQAHRKERNCSSVANVESDSEDSCGGYDMYRTKASKMMRKKAASFLSR